MLHDDTGGLIKILDALQSRIGIRHIVIGQGFTLPLYRGGNANFGRIALLVKSRLLVRVLAVAHGLGLVELQVQGAREPGAAVAQLLAKVIGNGTVIASGVFKSLDGEVKTGGRTDGIVVGIELLQQAGIVPGIHHDGDVPVVFRRRPHHGRPANIYVLNGFFVAAIRARHGRFKGIQVHHDHVDGSNTVVCHHLVIGAPAPQYAAVDGGMQGLDPARHHLRKARVIRYLGHFKARLPQQPAGASGRQ